MQYQVKFKTPEGKTFLSGVQPTYEDAMESVERMKLQNIKAISITMDGGNLL